VGIETCRPGQKLNNEGDQVAKTSYTSNLKNRQFQQLWRGLQDIPNYKRPPSPAAANKDLADNLDVFYLHSAVLELEKV